MASFWIGQRVPRDVDERLRMAAAAAAEQVLEAHVAAALELVDEGADRAPVERLLGAYARLHHLEVGQEGRLRERVLASLGREAGAAWSQRQLEAPRSILLRLARRLRGRVHHDLRDWLELQTARVQLALIDLHVRHALVFVRIVGEHGTTHQAIQSYARMLQLRPTTAEYLRLKALLAVDRAESAVRVEPIHPPAPHLPLRLADSGS
jgi:hypothetical protein